ncbi:hypothetical protein IP90_01880 [Luteimonas cucumeris]|uniref:Uncharacterized protein n=1 Tax=Luteimonas cucumeris TaxID=985012 RepID=A0A562L542_9GAMM|nr:hypothetical protein [Luteimonas cucumeris]TWI02782.1 hypothetical protein IP90_01880 [Luteimonas cucumeris]
MTAAAPTLATLLAGLDELQATLQSADLARADRLVVEHDRGMRDFLQAAGADGAARTDLERLQRAQQIVLEQMSRLRADAAREMRAFEQAERAARAYQSMT